MAAAEALQPLPPSLAWDAVGAVALALLLSPRHRRRRRRRLPPSLLLSPPYEEVWGLPSGRDGAVVLKGGDGRGAVGGSGCVTSAETVLLEQQSTDEVMAKLRDPATHVVVSVAPQPLAALAAHFAADAAEVRHPRGE